MSRKLELTVAVLGLIVAALALIPAFGQWLFPRETPLTPALPSPIALVLDTPTSTLSAGMATPTPAAAPSTPIPVTPAAAVADPAARLLDIAARCNVTQAAYTELPVAPKVALDTQLQDDAQFVKTFVVVAMELAGQAVLARDPQCLPELYAGAPLQEMQQLVAGDSSFQLYKSRFEWDFSRLLDVRVRNERRIEADVCLFQGLEVYNLQGVMLMSYPAEFSAATMVLERQSVDDPYYLTAIVELDPFSSCQS